MKRIIAVLLISIMTINAAENIRINPDVELLPLGDSIFVHVSWENSEAYGRFPSNGMIIIKNGKAVMIDTPFDNAKTEVIYNYFLNEMKVKIEKHIAGHFHEDNIGGLPFLHSKGVESIANNLTIDKCKTDSLEVPDIGFDEAYDLDFYGKKLECRFYGGGHSFDNIVVWIPEDGILFGGCLVKSINSRSLGFIGDATVDVWDQTVEKVLHAYPNTKIVVPGHGAIGGTELLKHTIELVREQR